MPDSVRKTLIVVAGPTAVGKTAEAIRLARKYDTEIISADSRQMFADMHIGTARPTEAELAAAPHHFVGFLPLEARYSAGDFGRDATDKIHNLFTEKDILIMVGGSGLYIKAVLSGFDDLPHKPDIRNYLTDLQKAKGTEALADELRKLDPSYCATADMQNTQRVMRALEVCLASGRPYSSFLSARGKELPFDVVLLGLNTERQKLYDRINLRVDQMMRNGLLLEVEKLTSFRNLNALRTVGYAELFEFLDGECDLNRAVERIKQNTRNFAKRQITWFKREEGMQWFDPENHRAIDDFLAEKGLR